MSNFKVRGLGRLAADPDSQSLPSGVTVTKLTLLSNGGQKEVATAMYCTAFDRTAIAINSRCHKGDEIHVEGRLSTTEYVVEGEKRRSTQLIIDDWHFVRSPAPATETAVDPSMTPPV